MIRKLAAPLVAIALVATLVYAANGPQPSVGLYWFQNSNPTLAGGVAAPLNQLLIRTDVPSLYYKSGAAATAWTLIGSVGGGGTVTSVACGSGLSCAPSPIVGAGTISLTTTAPTNSAGANVVTKSNGTNLVASSATDNATLFSIGTKFVVTEATGALAAADGTLVVTAGSSAINTTFWQVNTASGVPITLDYSGQSDTYVPTGDIGTKPTLSAGCGTGATVSAKGASKFTITTNATALGTCTATFAVALLSATPTCLVTSRNAVPVVYTCNATTVTLTTGLVGGQLYDIDAWDH